MDIWDISDWKNVVDVTKGALESLAILVGGVWVLFKFVLNREHANHLAISAWHEIQASDVRSSSAVAVFTVRLENKGKSKLRAMPRVVAGRQVAAYSDSKETLMNACGLQVRPIRAGVDAKHISWYELNDDLGLGEINLLEELEHSTDGTVDFHLEPSEVVEVTVLLVLPRDRYAVKVHFIGADQRMDFWSKLGWLDATHTETPVIARRPAAAGAIPAGRAL